MNKVSFENPEISIANKYSEYHLFYRKLSHVGWILVCVDFMWRDRKLADPCVCRFYVVVSWIFEFKGERQKNWSCWTVKSNTVMMSKDVKNRREMK